MGTNTPERPGKVLRNLQTFVPRVRSIRTYGSAGLNLAYLAMGAVDAYFEMASFLLDFVTYVCFCKRRVREELKVELPLDIFCSKFVQ